MRQIQDEEAMMIIYPERAIYGVKDDYLIVLVRYGLTLSPPLWKEKKRK
jgi:hypothetical protein